MTFIHCHIETHATHLVLFTHSLWNSTPKKQAGTQKSLVPNIQILLVFIYCNRCWEHWKWSNIFLPTQNEEAAASAVHFERSHRSDYYLLNYDCLWRRGAHKWHTKKHETRMITMATTTNWTIHRICHLTHFVHSIWSVHFHFVGNLFRTFWLSAQF